MRIAGRRRPGAFDAEVAKQVEALAACGPWERRWNSMGRPDIYCPKHEGWLQGDALLHALNGTATCSRAIIIGAVG